MTDPSRSPGGASFRAYVAHRMSTGDLTFPFILALGGGKV